jgi:uncharacterized OB-fold protein
VTRFLFRVYNHSIPLQVQAAIRDAQEKADAVDYVSAEKFKQTVAGTCPHCGAQLTGGKFCPECGKEIQTGVKFCPECGAKQG